MKKILLFLVVMLFGSTINAQLYVGGTAGITTQTIKNDDESSTNATYTISPEVGYMLNKTVGLGISASAGYCNMAASSGVDYSFIGIEPYVRVKFAHVGPVTFAADGVTSYAYCNLSEEDTHFNLFSLALRPAILVNMTDRLQLVARTTLFQYAHSNYDDDYDIDQINFGLLGNFGLGVYFNF